MKTSSSHRLGTKHDIQMLKNRSENERRLNFSVLIALGMVYEGLGGSTRANVAASLGFPEDEQRFRDGFKV